MKLLTIDFNGNPYLNLAAEEYILRNYELTEPILFLYINKPTVVLGKNQNVYEEANLKFCKENGILIARRLTGGGTVYHDEGNLNYSFISPFNNKLLHNFEPITKPIIEALKELGVETYLNERNDIYYEDYKISGTAQFTNRRNIISHGTLLFDTNMELLSGAIHPSKLDIQSRSIQSKRSKVINLKKVLPAGVSLKDIQARIIEKAVGKDLPFSQFVLPESDKEKINQLMSGKYATLEWIIDKSPKFTLSTSIRYRQNSFALKLKIDRGMIEEITLETRDDMKPLAESIQKTLLGKEFKSEALSALLRREQYKCSYHPMLGEVMQFILQVAIDPSINNSTNQ